MAGQKDLQMTLRKFYYTSQVNVSHSYAWRIYRPSGCKNKSGQEEIRVSAEELRSWGKSFDKLMKSSGKYNLNALIKLAR